MTQQDHTPTRHSDPAQTGRPASCGMTCQNRPGARSLLGGHADLDRHFSVVHSIGDLMRAFEANPSKNILMQDVALSKADVLKIASTLGNAYLHGAFAEVRDIRFDPSKSGSIALSAAHHPPHLDGTFVPEPPSAFVLHFDTCDPAGGGVSQFWALGELIEACPWELVDAALSATVRYARKRHDGTETDEVIGRILEKDRQGRLFLRWRHDTHVQPEVIDDAGKPIAAFIDWTLAYLAMTPPIEYAAQDGDTILIRQRHYLHGRSALSSTGSPRLALRTWIY